MLKSLFFGYLSLGWKRLFRAILFFWVLYWGIKFIDYGWKDYKFDKIFPTFSLGIILLITLSYIISGFIINKNKNQTKSELTTRQKGEKFLKELQKKGPLYDKLGESFVRPKTKK